MTLNSGLEAGDDPLDVEAIDWVVRLTVGEPSDADWQAFNGWHHADPAHQRAFAVASALCRDLRGMPLPPAPALPDNVIPFAAVAAPEQTAAQPINRHVKRRAFLGGGAIAASVVGGMMLTRPPLGLWPSLDELMADTRTEAGERRNFSPVAGVSVELNSRSSASRRDGGNRLDLVSGEAFIAVGSTQQPFIVKAGGQTLMAHKAAFNVQLLDGSVCVTCVRGSIATDRGPTITEGSEAMFAEDGALSQRRTTAETALAWRRGLLILDATPLSRALAQINRYFPGRLMLTDGSKAEWPVTGTFHVNQIELAIIQLQRLLNVTATRLPGGVVLLG